MAEKGNKNSTTKTTTSVKSTQPKSQTKSVKTAPSAKPTVTVRTAVKQPKPAATARTSTQQPKSAATVKPAVKQPKPAATVRTSVQQQKSTATAKPAVKQSKPATTVRTSAQQKPTATLKTAEKLRTTAASNPIASARSAPPKMAVKNSAVKPASATESKVKRTEPQTVTRRPSVKANEADNYIAQSKNTYSSYSDKSAYAYDDRFADNTADNTYNSRAAESSAASNDIEISAPAKKRGARRAVADSEPVDEFVTSKKRKNRKSEERPYISDEKSEAAIAVSHKKVRAVAVTVTALIMIACLVIGIMVALRSCDAHPDDVLTMQDILKSDAVSVNDKKQVTQVGYSSTTLGTTDRNKPVAGASDGGLTATDGTSAYPVYGSTKKNLTPELKSAILAENNQICAKPTVNAAGVYDKMDKDGYLYLLDGTPVTDGQGNPRRLYKHSASVGLYGGDVADNEPAVIKKVTLRPRTYSSYYNVTGVYAPAGEVITVRISEEDMEATGGIVIHIGQALYNGKANNIWSARDFNRMPVVLNTMNVNKQTATLGEDGYYTAYVGSFLGGPLYIRDERVTFSVEISGAVNYSHFILGVTTEEEFDLYSRSSAPYFDLEVWDSGVLHSGPKAYASSFDYNDIYKAAVLWEKISLVSTKVANQGIVFLYDPFVAAGAAVAFPGQRSVNCPLSWMRDSLNYSSFVTVGAWGNVHEYHHNFQGGWGVGYTGEVTNNALNLVSYSLFTKVSSARQIAAFGGEGLSGWNQYTSATWALNRVNLGGGNIQSTNGLAVYATLLHNFGQDAFIKAASASGAAYFNKWATVTHYDFSYFASLVSAYVDPNSTGNFNLTPTDYPTFVPVASVYQTGRSYNYDGEKRYIKTMQPYMIPVGQPFTVDLRPYTVNSANQYISGSVVLPDGFTYNIKGIKTDGLNGTFTQTSEEKVYTFTPDSEMHSGNIYVTLEITDVNNRFKVEDVDLILEFDQSREINKNLLERTVYTFEAGACPTDATAAYNSNYAGHINKKEENNVNPTQNSNTDVWMAGDDVPLNSVIEVRGKLFFPDAGKYRIAFRGRWNVALYLSFDGGNTYDLKAQVVEPAGGGTANFRLTDGTYYDCEVEADTWIYFKEVMICGRSGGKGSYFGIGVGQFTTPMYTTTTDSNGNIHYWNASGQEVSAEEASNTEPIAPSKVSYVTAYRNGYEFRKEFESDYFYERSYGYSYSKVAKLGENASIVSTNAVAWAETPIQNMLKDNSDMFRANNASPNPTAENPVEITVDIGREICANKVKLFGFYNGNSYYPINYTILVGTTLDNMTPFGAKVEGASSTDGNVGFDIDEPITFRYYKIVIEKWSVGFVQFRYVEFTHQIDGTAKLVSPDDDMFTYKGEWEAKAVDSDFGHVYVGNGATLEFEFEGTQFALLASECFGVEYEVYVDGNKINSLFTQNDGSAIYLNFLSQKFDYGRHKVTVYCKGEANIDAVAIYG